MVEVADFLQKKFGVGVLENKAKQSDWLSWYKNTNGWRNYYVTLANERRSKKYIKVYNNRMRSNGLFACMCPVEKSESQYCLNLSIV